MLGRVLRGVMVTALLLAAAGCARQEVSARLSGASMAAGALPAMRWDHRAEAADWTRATLGALESHGAALPHSLPADIGRFCPGYESASLDERRAFWAGLLSALAKHESTWNPRAVGGGGRWFGLVQIAPRTAQGYGCRAQSGADLQEGGANLSCAVRIMARTVARDGVIAQGGRGVAADWGPFKVAGKQADIAAWTSSQSYCR
ncbi:transglycosylase SLT domain-containing protein [Actibacterium sp. MT2.3-13A]|uniref:transglycosylase SLT domain-containing protein n=1 Tax=Actibacterium sp. MT2.3-13A TaxID=2828332 RepID=UPI002013201D|nr:transglycosylase SLT domain-containing protein [Actibacterium sp. MT2.3-13A]